jgi:UrcA family protein
VYASTTPARPEPPDRGRALRAAAALAAGLISLAGIANVARADDLQPPRQRVSYADLDLRSSAGQEALVQRVRTAAAAVCRAPGFRASIVDATYLAHRHCVRVAFTGGMAQADEAITVAQLAR